MDSRSGSSFHEPTTVASACLLGACNGVRSHSSTADFRNRHWSSILRPARPWVCTMRQTASSGTRRYAAASVSVSTLTDSLARFGVRPFAERWPGFDFVGGIVVVSGVHRLLSYHVRPAHYSLRRKAGWLASPPEAMYASKSSTSSLLSR